MPMLSLEGTPPMSLREFRSTCADHLESRDLEALDAVLDPSFLTDKRPAPTPFAHAWRDSETLLRNAAVKVRAARYKEDPASYLKEEEGSDVYIEKAVADAYAKSNPLEREKALDQYRWAELEDLAGFDTFSGSSIVAYGLKLKLCERWAGMKEQEGSEKLEELVRMKPSEEMVDA